jgi:retron-type reverse transcriptase
MRKVPFSKLRNNSDIADHLGCSIDALQKLLPPTEHSPYLKMKIPKKNMSNRGKYRVVYKVIDFTLELLQKNIATALSQSYSFPDYVQGFVRGGSIFKNAKQHLAKKYVMNVDIKNFFESIDYDAVVKAFEDVGCNHEVAVTFAWLTTLDSFLPQGASSSPIIANLVCKEMDVELNCLAESYSLTYTRYADDITFSGDICPKREELEALLLKQGFSINNDKFKIVKRGQNQYVTGLTVFDDSSPRVPRNIKRYLRMVLYYAEKYGMDNHLEKVFGDEKEFVREFEKRRIKGWIDFICSVEPPLGAKLKKQWYALED